MASLFEQVRSLIERSKVSRYRIAKDLDLDQGQLSKLMSGKAGLSVEALERVLDYLGHETVIRPKRQKKGQ